MGWGEMTLSAECSATAGAREPARYLDNIVVLCARRGVQIFHADRVGVVLLQNLDPHARRHLRHEPTRLLDLLHSHVVDVYLRKQI